MNFRKLLMSSIATLIVSTPPSYAGPCSVRIDQMQVQIDAKLNAAAAAGRAGDETTAATDHRQPTPRSIAAAELKLGDVSQNIVQSVGEAMALARKADVAGDSIGCAQALGDAQRALGN
jgi:hypothetical protein